MKYYSLFELENGTQFYYNSQTNSLYNTAGDLINLPPLKPLEWYETEEKNHGVDTKTNAPIAIRILLGHACNYNCTYCMQKDIGNPDERPQSFFTETFISSVKNSLNIEKLKRVELWGGEPFLYWKDMVEIMKFFDSPDREFFISTNGSPFVQKHVDFFATLKGRVMINLSHDAYGQEELRGEDILKNPRKVDIIKKLMALSNVALGVGCVVSSTNYDLFAINEYFKSFATANGIPNLKVTFIPAKNYDETNSQNSANYIIRGDDLIKFRKILKDFIQACLSDTKNEVYLRNNILHSPEGIINYATFLKHQAPVTIKSSCGADANDVLSVDIQGNVRLCPHTDKSFISGRIDDLENVRIKKLDLDRKIQHCFKCPLKRLCRSSCPIKFPDEVFYSNCAFEKVWWGEIQEAAMGLLFGQSVSHIKDGLVDFYK